MALELLASHLEKEIKLKLVLTLLFTLNEFHVDKNLKDET